MKVGDLVKVKECNTDMGLGVRFPCECFFCNGNSNRVGLVTGPAPLNSWRVMLDCGEWRVDNFE